MSGPIPGGAHGIYGRTGHVWDREAERLLDPAAMFDVAALERAVRDPYCDRLTRERRDRHREAIGEDIAAEDLFPECPPLEDLSLILGSAGGERFDRIGLYAGPYVAGSYAEGAYEITLPVTAAVLDAVKPGYRPHFAARR